MVTVQGPFCRISWEQVNLNSPDQVKSYLLSQGWVPTEWNTKKEGRETIRTSPKLTEDSFDSVQGDLPKKIARRAILEHRRKMLKNVRKKDNEETGWLNVLRDDGRIEARGIPCATPTGRYRHSNVVNVPSVHAVYGSDIRDLFIAPPGYSLVGVDAAALEARIQAHYVYPFKGGQALADLLINGDIHSNNQALWKLPDRNDAKSPYYCLMYGGQPAKLAETMGCTLYEAKNYYDDFWNAYTPLDQLKEMLTKAWDSRGGKNGGYLRGLDGRKLFARSPHALVNLMFQSGGSIAVKLATVFTDNLCTARGLDSTQVIHMHDEFQRETLNEDVEDVKAIAIKSFDKAGQYFQLNIPLVGEVKVGRSWKETH
jgi:DNA polymerase I